MVDEINRGEIIAAMDDVILAITDGQPVPMDRMRSLPPWRAVMMARLALAAGALDGDTVAVLVAEAVVVGGAGRLEPFTQCAELEFFFVGNPPRRCILPAGHATPHDTGMP
jgi:hypothetical protein